MLFDQLYPYRFQLFLMTLLAILFGSLLMPVEWFETVASPIFFILNLTAGVIFVRHNKHMYRAVLALLMIAVLVYGVHLLGIKHTEQINFIRLVCFFIFYAIVTVNIINQVTKASIIKRKVILGLISGYVSLGLLAFFMFSMIEYLQPNSFSGLYADDNLTYIPNRMLYFSYVTLLTIGYGEILPVSNLAQKGAILVALFGQFYTVILTAIVVGKYLNQNA